MYWKMIYTWSTFEDKTLSKVKARSLPRTSWWCCGMRRTHICSPASFSLGSRGRTCMHKMVSKLYEWVCWDLILFVCFGITSHFNIWGHIATVPVCSSGTLTNVLATQECHAANTGRNIPSCHSLQTHGWPVAVLSIDVEHHTGIHSYPF